MWPLGQGNDSVPFYDVRIYFLHQPCSLPTNVLSGPPWNTVLQSGLVDLSLIWCYWTGSNVGALWACGIDPDNEPLCCLMAVQPLAHRRTVASLCILHKMTTGDAPSAVTALSLPLSAPVHSKKNSVHMEHSSVPWRGTYLEYLTVQYGTFVSVPFWNTLK